MEFLSPELITALQGVSPIVAVILVIALLAWLISRLTYPLNQMAKTVASTSVKNSDVLVTLEHTMQQLAEILKGIASQAQSLESLKNELKRSSTMFSAGLVIADRAGKLLFANERAKDILGWEYDQFPGGSDAITTPTMSPLEQPIIPDMWPMQQTLKTGRTIENVPLYLFNDNKQAYEWVMVSTYPCIECQASDTEPKWVTVVLQSVDGMHRF